MNIQRAIPDELQIHKSPDKIDQVVRVVRPRHILYLFSMIMLVAAAIIWSIVTRVPVYVYGNGILINESGISEIKSPFPGKVSQLAVKIGERVEQGDELATIEQLDLAFDVKRLESQIREVKENLEWLLENADAGKREKAIIRLRAEMGRYDRSIRLLDSSSDYYEIELSELKKRKATDELRLFDLVNYRNERVFEFRNALLSYESELQLKRNQLVNQTKIISPYAGTVVDMSYNNGDIFTQGSTFMIIENDDYNRSNLVAQIYVHSNEGKKVQPGMTVQLAPSTIPPEESGYLLGTVSYISKYTQTESGMNRVLRNPKLVEELSKDGLPMLVEVKLIPDSTTFSRFRWTTSSGPRRELLSGTLTRANIISEQRRPISFIIPFL